MAIVCNWDNFNGIDGGNVNQCVGGYREALVTRKSDINLANITINAAGEITAFPFNALGGFKRFRPIANDDVTTYAAPGARASENAPMIWAPSIVGQFYQVNNAFDREIDAIKNCQDLVFVIRDNNCNIILEGLELKDDCDGGQIWDCALAGIRLSATGFDISTTNGAVVSPLTFSGRRQCAKRYFDTTALSWAGLEAFII